ncbi:plasmid pRiA4b ORF-3 family protein [Psychrobacter sp.]|uniref:plasmid pRiA4b ORF-3 family protein n=1 Tax=Psychrobacter sp. TaxID=56811 RepID=UPI0025F84258|nr:plasmid pRiA4b ORF-3 family protein [Psychrobacter sp.]
MKVYQLKVSLFGYHEQPINQLHRIIEISEDSTFEDLHDAIFDAFDRDDLHLYSFFLTKKDSKNMHDIRKAPSIADPYSFSEGSVFGDESDNAATTKIKDAKLKEKDVFHYWFDFGDDWWHRIRVEKITTDSKSKKAFVKVSKKVGKSPAQYEEYDEEDEYFDDINIKDIVFGSGDFGELMDSDQLNDIDIDDEDLEFLMQTMSDNSPEAMQKIVDKYGIDKVVSWLEVMGMPNTDQFKTMLKNIPIIQFLESCNESNLTLQQEHELLKDLIDYLQTRLANIEQSIVQADNLAQVTYTKKSK